MAIIKRLHWFVLKSFLPLFAMTFFIVLFIVLMQFLWKYIDDLVGKGLSFSVMGELFFYAAVSMVPMALPLAILLASLMTFGNMGEKLELTAMKASGISLVQVMAPLIVLVSGIGIGAFFFQNNVLPKAQVKMWTLLFSMRQKSPELEIPEGAFYSEIPGYNLYVKHKDRETGKMYDMMIYDVSRGGDNSTILLADSAQLAFTSDMRYLYLHLFTGEQFENLRDQSNLDRNVPFRRESFLEKEVLIPFDANFNRLDEGGMRKQYVGKNIAELRHTIDSVSNRLDSLAVNNLQYLQEDGYSLAAPLYRTEAIRKNGTPMVAGYGDKLFAPSADGKKSEVLPAPLPFDTLIERLTPGRKIEMLSRARERVKSQTESLEYQSLTIADEKKMIRRHEIELIKKFTLSVACLIMFFIGAPLGAIIRKGGLGTPLVISVLLFLVYYIIDNTGYKMARDGHITVWVGMWLSTFILAPLGVYVTYKAMNDSSVFDKDVYIGRLRKLLGLHDSRTITFKEVIMEEISRPVALGYVIGLESDISRFLGKRKKRLGYNRYWKYGAGRDEIRKIGTDMDNMVAYMQNSPDAALINILSEFPVVSSAWVYRPFRNAILSRAVEIVFPVGILFWLIARIRLRRLGKELKLSLTLCNRLIEKLNE